MSDEPKKPGEDELPAGGEGGDGQPEAEPPAEVDAEAEAAAHAKAEAEAKAKAEAAAKAKAAAEAKAAEEAAKPPWEKLPVAPEDEDASGEPLVEELRGAHGEAIEAAFVCGGDLRVHVARSAIAEVCASLKARGYTMVEDLCGVHYPDREGREFEVVYHLFNIAENRRVRLKVAAAEGEAVPTTVPVFKGMNWLEREAYDMYGIRFEGHPDMTRILLWEGFNGHPLRKDFPVEGIDTGAAIYPEYYEESAGPVTGTGTGWKPQPPPAPEPAESASEAPAAEEGEG